MNANNGGPAFPVDEIDQVTHQLYVQHMGMSLRDYYAAKAMQGILAGGFYNPGQADSISRDAKAIADAMIAARGTK